MRLAFVLNLASGHLDDALDTASAAEEGGSRRESTKALWWQLVAASNKHPALTHPPKSILLSLSVCLSHSFCVCLSHCLTLSLFLVLCSVCLPVCPSVCLCLCLWLRSRGHETAPWIVPCVLLYNDKTANINTGSTLYTYSSLTHFVIIPWTVGNRTLH